MTTSAMLRRSKMEPSQVELGSHILNESVCGAWNILCFRSLDDINIWLFQYQPLCCKTDLRSQFLLKTLWHWLHS